MKRLFLLLALVVASYAQEEVLPSDATLLDQRGLATLMMRELLVPFNSINQLVDWINQVPRSVFLDCPTDEVAFGLVCDPNQISRQDLDNYFCGSDPSNFGWCGAFWQQQDENKRFSTRGVSNGALAVFDLEDEYSEMFGRVCSCHCGCQRGCYPGVPGCGSFDCPEGACTVETPTPFCPECPACEAIVCDLDDYCCEDEWDDICVDEALEFCYGQEPITDGDGFDGFDGLERQESCGKRARQDNCALNPHLIQYCEGYFMNSSIDGLDYACKFENGACSLGTTLC